MARPTPRTKSISSKVTQPEYALIEQVASAAGQSTSDWVRATLIEQASSKAKAMEETVLAELLGLRTILLNLFYSMAAKTGAVTAEQMQSVIARADAEKLERARKQLTPTKSAEAKTAPAEIEVQ